MRDGWPVMAPLTPSNTKSSDDSGTDDATPAERTLASRGQVIRQFGILLGFLVVYSAFALASPDFLKSDNLTNIALQSAMNTVIAIGMTMVIITGGIDLSVGSVVGFTSVVGASVLVSAGVWPGILATLALGVGLGIVNGILIAHLRLQPFIATLGALSLYRGLALVYTGGFPVYNLPKGFRDIFAGTVGPIPTPVIIALIVAVAALVILKRAVLGEHIFSVGGNEEGARLSGVGVRTVKVVVYAISGLLASVGGLILIGRLGAAEPIGGTGFELDAIGAAAIGGASLAGGKGSVIGTILGALLLGGLRNGLTLMNVQSFWQQVATGLVIILAVLLDQITRERQ